MRTTDMRQDELEAMLATMRDVVPAPSDDLMTRVLDEAMQLQPQVFSVSPVPPARPGLWARIIGQLGGLPAVAGLCSAAVAGVIIGYSDPTTLDFLTSGIASDVLGDADLFPTSDFLAAEG